MTRPGLAALVVAVGLAIGCGTDPAERRGGDAPAARTPRTSCGLAPATVAILGRLEAPVVIRGYFSERTHPQLAPLIPPIRRWLAAYRRAAPQRVDLAIVDPAASESARRDLQRRRITAAPFRVDSKTESTVVHAYFHLVISVGERSVVLGFEDLVRVDQQPDGSIRIALDNPEYELTAAIKKLASGPRAPRIALWTPPAGGSQNFDLLRDYLGREADVVSAELARGSLDPAIDALVLAGPAGLTPAEVRAVDDLVRRGGGLVVFAGRYRLDLASRQLRVEKVSTGLEELLARQGISIDEALVLDEESDSLPVPVDRDVGGMTVRDIRQVRYPYFPQVASGRIAGAAARGISLAVLHFASPVRAGKGGTVLLRSSDRAWLERAPQVAPDFKTHADTGFPPPPAARAPAPLAIAAGRIVVVGSSSFASDELLELSRQASGNLQNLELAGNLVAHALGDTELLSLHACRGAAPPR